MTLANVRVEENTCNTLGGGLSLGGGCVANVGEGATFARNAAGRFVGERCHFEGAAGGGAVAIRPNVEAIEHPTTLIATECAFVENVAADGGAVFVTEAAAFAANAAACASARAPSSRETKPRDVPARKPRVDRPRPRPLTRVPLPPKVAATAGVCTPPRA